jgi:hypothetical protein
LRGPPLTARRDGGRYRSEPYLVDSAICGLNRQDFAAG